MIIIQNKQKIRKLTKNRCYAILPPSQIISKKNSFSLSQIISKKDQQLSFSKEN